MLTAEPCRLYSPALHPTARVAGVDCWHGPVISTFSGDVFPPPAEFGRVAGSQDKCLAFWLHTQLDVDRYF